MMSKRLSLLQPLLRPRPRPAALSSALTRVRNLHVGETDPGMNGGYINPPAIKRSQRDPYGDWWDKQERRNYGEPVHEDNDILGVFSTEVYSHATPAKAWASLGTFVLATLGLCYVVSLYYPDVPAVPRAWGDGLETELGGPNTLLAKKDENDV